MLAEGVLPGEAAGARAADEVEVRNHALADATGIDAVTHRVDDSDEFVSGNPRQERRIVPELSLDAVEDGQPDAAGLDVDAHLALAGRRPRHLDELERAAPGGDARGAHRRHAASSGSKGRPCRHSAPPSVRIPLAMLIVFASAKLLAELFERLGQPGIVGEILAGVIIGPSALNWIAPSDFLTALNEGWNSKA